MGRDDGHVYCTICGLPAAPIGATGAWNHNCQPKANPSGFIRVTADTWWPNGDSRPFREHWLAVAHIEDVGYGSDGTAVISMASGIQHCCETLNAADVMALLSVRAL